MANDILNGLNIGDAGNNETVANFFTLAGNAPTVVNGSTGFWPDQADWYRFIAPVNGTVFFNLAGLSSDLDIYLYDALGFGLAYSENFGTSEEDFLFNVTQGSTYYLEVSPFDLGSNYALNIQYSNTPPPTGAPDIVNGYNMGDAGDTPAVASLRTLNVISDSVITGSTGYYFDKSDWYNFQVGTSGQMEFSLTGLTSDLDLYLFENGGDFPVASSESAGTTDEYFSYQLVAGNSYEIVMYPYDGGSEYTLRLDSVNMNFTLDEIPLINSGLSNITEVAVQQIFVGLLGRPVKASGEAYWTEQVEADNGFGLTEMMWNIVNQQPEYINAFTGLNRQEAVTLHFNYLFSRDPTFDNDGYNYWVNGDGSSIPTDELVLALLLGTIGDDQQTLSNKMFVADYVSDNEPLLAAPAGVPMLGLVTSEIATVISALSAVDLFT